MKTLIIALLILPFTVEAQSWNTVGSAEFSLDTVGYTSIAINSSGTPYVAYMDFGHSKKATVMMYNGTNWVTVGSPGFSVGRVNWITIAIDGSGTPYVAYSDGVNGGKATVMAYNGSSWVYVGSPDFSDSTAYDITLAISDSNILYVAYGDASIGYKATVMKFNGSSWVYVGSHGFSAGQTLFTSIAINNDGVPYVVYQDVITPMQGATVMKFNGSNWVVVGSPGFSMRQVQYTSIAIDSSGTPYVVYQDDSIPSSFTGKATVMKYNGSTWVTVGSAGFSAGQAQWTSIAVDGSGTPYVVYEDASTISPKATVMKFNGIIWVDVCSPDFSASYANWTSIAINNSGIPYVAFEDGYTSVAGATVMAFDTTISPITGVDTVCIGDSIILSDYTVGGAWNSSNTTVATIDAMTGVLSGVSAGTVSISYTASGHSTFFIITVNSCSALASTILNQNDKIEIYPNPNTGLFTVNLATNDNENAQIIITNTLGEKVKELNILTNKETDVQLQVPAGIYFISAITKSGSITSKIIIE